MFYHPKRCISTVVHGDDFTSLAVESDLLWLRDSLKKVFLIKDRGILGPESHDLKEIRLLNRIIAWEPEGIRYEADQRHSEILVSEFELDSAKGVDTPGTVENKLIEGQEDLENVLPIYGHQVPCCSCAL